MIRKPPKDVVQRYKKNPIITLDDIPFRCNSVFNTGATKLGDEYILMLRVEDQIGHSFLALARSKDGFDFKIDPKPAMVPSNEEPFRTYEKYGLEDPRITKIGDTYYIMYTAYSSHAPLLGLAKTRDFETFERIGIVSLPENKDGALFPAKINGRYVRLDRPVPGGSSRAANIWISFSPDLIHWGDAQCLMQGIENSWDSQRIGAGAPPFETSQGWLEIYHGVKETVCGRIYRLGVVLLDREDPRKIIGRARIPILSPREPYERTGDVPNVIFCCGVIPNEKKDEVLIYYGASDTCICAGIASISELIDMALNVTPILSTHAMENTT